MRHDLTVVGLADLGLGRVGDPAYCTLPNVGLRDGRSLCFSFLLWQHKDDATHGDPLRKRRYSISLGRQKVHGRCFMMLTDPALARIPSHIGPQMH